jgi:kinesin family member 1
MTVSVVPSNQDGKELGEKAYVDNPKKLLKKPFHFQLIISSCEIIQTQYTKGFKIKYRFYKDPSITETHNVSNELKSKFYYNRLIHIDSITEVLFKIYVFLLYL